MVDELFRCAYQYEASKYFADLQPGMTFSASAMHTVIEANILYQPRSSNVWGAVFQAFITPLINTQQAEVSGYQQSVRASNHKHAYKEYRKL